MMLRCLLVLCLCGRFLFAATSTTWEISGFNDLLKGRISGLSLNADGTLLPGPHLVWSASLDQPALWHMAAGPDGSIYAATGHTGRVIRIMPDGKTTTVWRADQSDVFAICVDSAGHVYAGTSPNGGVYRIENGKGTEVWHSPGKYIWALEPAPDGALFIGGGGPGRVYRYAGDATSVYYDSEQGNVTALALGANGHLYAGTDPNGLLFDINPARKATVLYDSSLPEIHSLAIDPQGVIYAAAMGGAVPARSGGAPASAGAVTSSVVATSPTVITVTEAKDNTVGATPVDLDPAGKSTDISRGPTSSISATAPSTAGTVAETSGVEKSAIYRITPDGVVQNVRSSKDDNVYSLWLDGGAVLFSTDDHGRIYRWEGSRITLLAEPGAGETTQLVKRNDTLYAAMSNPARLLALNFGSGGSGVYESPVHDAAASVARWGHLRWHGSGSGVVVRTRTGFSARPDGTWSEWSAPLSDPAHELIASPAGRFIQFRAEFPSGTNARVDAFDVPFLPQNTPPAVHSITVTSVVNSNPAKSTAAAAGSGSAYSITVTDTGEAPAASSATSATQSVSRLQSTQTQISWQAEDADGDKLVYSVYFRAEEGTEWQLVRSRMFENTLLLDPDVFADGRYLFRVVASDAPSNAAEFAHQAELVSTPVVIDNTPPVVTISTPQRSGATLDLEVSAQDKTSPLRLCEYSLDAGSWQPIESVDGITDSNQERFRLHLDKVRPGEHLLVFRVYDTANNAGLAKVVLR